MFSKISWQSYGTAVIILIVLYYLVVFLIYRKNLSLRGHFQKHLQHQAVASALFSNEIKQPTDQQIIQSSPDLLPLVHDLVDELGALIRQAAIEQMSKDDLTQTIKAVIKKYPTLYGSPYQTSINNLIAQECETHCNTHFSAEEIVRLW